MPTPTPTVAINTVLLITAETCPARTDKSGSATVIKTPIIKQTIKSTHTFLDFVRPVPTCSPIGVIARSAPRLKRPIPKIRNTAQTANATISVTVKSTSGVKEIIKTIAATGNTEINASLSFEKSIFAIYILPCSQPVCETLTYYKYVIIN